MMFKINALLVLIVFFYNACNQPSGNKENTVAVAAVAAAGYDLSKPEILKMPGSLNELSGITFNKGNPDTLYAEQDEEGRLFYFPTTSLDVKHQHFGKKGDYEDIAICNGTVIMLRSDGVLFSFPLNIHGDKEIKDVQETAGILPKSEYEGMYADEASGRLYVLCKECKDDNASKSITGYILQMTADKSIGLKSDFKVNTKDIAAKLGEKKLVFRPSALAKNSRNDEWYILSSVNKLLVITDANWGIKEVFPLNPALFPQPEGMAFDRDDNLYISNERAESGNATVLKFSLVKDK